MGKVQRQARKHNSKFSKSTVVRRQHSHQQRQLASTVAAPSARSHQGRQQARLKAPFTKYDKVLLVGEGDFSFSLSLKLHHNVRQIVATCYDSKDVLQSKYPEVQKTTTQLQSLTRSNDVPTERQETSEGNENATDTEEEWKGFSPSPPSSPVHEEQIEDPSRPLEEATVKVLYGIDATKLSSAHKKALRPYSPFTKIVFNFPHVGGLSTDVNRQVRYNQELLVGFFHSAKSLLSSRDHPAKIRQASEDEAGYYADISAAIEGPDPGAVNGQILVTLFEGEPYTLWNVRDLARHCGLKVVESFKFPWSAYPGYQHARTAGDITTGKDRGNEGKRKGAWRGEERDARCYVLEDQNAESEDVQSPQPKRRRKQGDEDDDSG
ncbi:uncharacterized protein Z519_02632 [Cladophialophora bantiana CBS 173.52]|uniref:25S rRNA (uridine-N(3))-methyltransferase BMT5-like domain-containing protein n=1 Tax=Cladophialophora bantiana (strain ATCC 10958 / CBS 173.52 / CDC B-1940 / NIH 8579) TaxID=1442370 RepID=A0A0D2I224_CLAB1|nr:uncharacterized protein Z519_02632 [Cladophialophora bantiana CBS 173.52]KIW97240.1 hypothetical protein Z519_02632 [Cladophialophora bantiana CBS 173.52]